MITQRVILNEISERPRLGRIRNRLENIWRYQQAEKQARVKKRVLFARETRRCTNLEKERKKKRGRWTLNVRLGFFGEESSGKSCALVAPCSSNVSRNRERNVSALLERLTRSRREYVPWMDTPRRNRRKLQPNFSKSYGMTDNRRERSRTAFAILRRKYCP